MDALEMAVNFPQCIVYGLYKRRWFFYGKKENKDKICKSGGLDGEFIRKKFIWKMLFYREFLRSNPFCPTQ